MSPVGLRLLEHVHGHLACLATIALYHPVLLRRRGAHRSLVAAAAATALVSVAAALGMCLYPAYRAHTKPAIFAASSLLGNAFERKEHLAMAVVALAWTGLVANWAAVRERGPAAELRQLAFVAYSWGAALATLSAGLGLWVAVFRSL